jgi:hypothetical protein
MERSDHFQNKIANYKSQITNGLIDFSCHAEVEGAQGFGAFAIADGAIDEQFTAMQQKEAIGNRSCFCEIVSGEQNSRLLPGQGADGRPEAGRRAGVEAARRFIEQKHAGALDQRARNPEPLVHAARELHHQYVGLLFEASIAENFLNPLRPFAT